jgi:hypothetical protein
MFCDAGADGNVSGLASGAGAVPVIGACAEICAFGMIISVCSVEMSCTGALFCTDGLLLLLSASVSGLLAVFVLGLFVRE